MKINKSALRVPHSAVCTLYSVLCTLSFSLCMTSCLDEELPTDVVTESQKEESAQTVEALLQALPAHLHADGSSSYGHYAFGYGAIMHIRDMQTGDMAIAESNYNQFVAWERNVSMGANSAFMQYIWNYYYSSIHACNLLLSSLPADENKHTDKEKAANAAARAYRALFYLDMARAYEFLPNDVYATGMNSEGNNVEGLTVPIVDENTTEESARHNPRASRQEMYEFILNDLTVADSLISNVDNLYPSDRTLPHSYSVKGLKARLYMWVEDYDKAYTAAIDAQNEAKKVGLQYMINTSSLYYVDENQTLLIGYNDPNTFMWADTQTADNSTVKSGICNWTSWMCPLTTYGYSANGAMSCIDMSLYRSIEDGDYRKQLYAVNFTGYPDGMAVKFAPGGLDFSNPLVSAASSYPIMRLEEMALIECEAAAHLSPAAGKAALESFMNTYCMLQGKYVYDGEMSKEGIICEIIKQKRIELWGEGQSFFDIKRMNISVRRGYKGTNFTSLTRFNTNGRPAWMNWVIVLTEENNNDAVRGMNNPDPSDKYKVWTE